MKIDVLSVEPLCDKAKCAASLNEFLDGFSDEPLLTEETVCAKRFTMNGHDDALQCCEEALITYTPDETLAGLKIDGHSQYQLTDSKGQQFMMIVLEALPGQLRVMKGHIPYGEIAPGAAELICVFDIARFPDLVKLTEFDLEDLPSFHEARMEVLSREGNTLRLYICDGLFSPINMTMTLTGITREESCMDDADDPWAYFRQEACVSGVELRCDEAKYSVRIHNNYCAVGQRDGKRYIAQRVINELLICCEKLEMSFARRSSE